MMNDYPTSLLFNPFSKKHFFLTPLKIPKSLYEPNVPDKPIETVATTAFLAARSDASNILEEKHWRHSMKSTLILIGV